MRRLQRTVYYLSGFIPASFALFFAILLLLHIPILHDPAFYFLPFISRRYIPIAVLYFAFVIIIWYLICTLMNRSKSLTIVLVFLFAFVPRMLLLWYYQNSILPFSDFLWSWNVAQGAREGYSFVAHLPFPAYQNWAFAEYLITRVLPNEYYSILCFNALIDSMIAVVLVLLVNNISPQKKRVAILASLLYGLFPPAIFYCATGTPEFITIICNLLGIICLSDSLDGNVHYYRLFGAGFLLGISSSFKAFSSVIIIAYITVDLLMVKKKILYRVCEWVLLIIVTLITEYIMLTATSTWLGTDLSQYSKGVLYHQLLVGLNTEGEGQIHLGTLSRGFWNYFIENGNDSMAAGEYAKNLLISDWKQHYAQIPELLLEKIIWAWQDDLIPIKYFIDDIGIGTIHQKLMELVTTLVPCVSQVMYVCLTGMWMCKIAFYKVEPDINCKKLFVSMIIFGYFCLLLIIEAQSRYKCLILPLICIQSAFGIDLVDRVLINWCKSRRKNGINKG